MAIEYVSTITEGTRVERKYFATYVNVGDSITATSGTPAWHLIGARVEDAAMELNADIEQTSDILGRSYAEYSGLKPQMGMEPFTIHQGDELALDLMEKYYAKDQAAFSNYEVMNVFGWLKNGTATTSDGKLLAEVHKKSTIAPQSIGGSTNADMPIEIYYSNDCVYGTVDAISENPTFTPAS